MTPRQIERIQQLNELRTSGAISEEEFEEQKTKALAGRSRWVVLTAIAGAVLVLGISAYAGLGTGQNGLISVRNSSDITGNSSAARSASLEANAPPASEPDVAAASGAGAQQPSPSPTLTSTVADKGNDFAATDDEPCVGYWRTPIASGGYATVRVQDVSPSAGAPLYDINYAAGASRRMVSGAVLPEQLTATVGPEPDPDEPDPSATLSKGHLQVSWGNTDSLEMNCGSNTATDGINVWQRITAAQFERLRR